MKKGELTAFEAGLKFPCKPILVVSNRKGILLTVKIAATVVSYYYYTMSVLSNFDSYILFLV